MRLLHFFDGRRIESHLQIDYILGLQKYCQVFIYGPFEQTRNGKEISPVAYNASTSLIDVVKTIKPDVIVLPEYAIFHSQFQSCEEISKITDIPKISIEIDSYVIDKSLKWHTALGIDFIISRGPFRKEYFDVPSVWLPWSIPDEFYLKEFTSSRLNKILFFGGGRFGANKFYKTRRQAIYLLERADLLDYFPPNSYRMYRDFLRKYKCALSCSLSDLHMPPAKNWEIAGSGGLLLTNDFIGRKVIFGDKLFVEYKDDCSDIVEKATDILTNDYSDLAYMAWKVIGEKHLHSKRILELYNIINSVVSGKEVPDNWNIDYL